MPLSMVLASSSCVRELLITGKKIENSKRNLDNKKKLNKTLQNTNLRSN
jgi:hypothetical protein